MHFLRKHDFTILLCLYFFLLPIGKTLWYPLLVMAITGGVVFVKEWRTGALASGTKWLIGLGACIWIPALFSTPTSIDVGRSLVFVGAYPLFFLAAYFLYHRLKTGVNPWHAIYIIIGIVIFWGVLAIWQYSDPSNPFGPGGTHNQGLHTRDNPFVDGGLMMGVILGSLFSFLMFALLERGYPLAALALALFIAGLCWISGTRSSWVSLLFTLCALPVLAIVRGFKLTPQRIAIGLVMLAGVAAAGGWLYQKPGLNAKLNQTLIFFQNPTLETLDQTLSGRIDIWIDAIAIGNENPLVGAGVNNYRFAAPLVESPAGTRWISEVNDPESPHKLQGAAHTHQVMMETFSGAGWSGLIGLLLFYGLLTRFTLMTFKQGSLLAVGAVLAFWAYFWPINTHNNFHGGWVSAWFWVWLGLAVGAYYASRGQVNKTKSELNH